MSKIKVSQDRKTENVIFQADNFKAVFTIEMFRRIQNRGGMSINNKNVQDINKNQWQITEHSYYGKVVLTHKEKTIKINMEHIYSQLKI